MNTFTKMAEDWIRQNSTQAAKQPQAIFVPSDSTLTQDAAEWREPFSRWLDSACMFSPRCFGGLACLHIAFCEWAVRQGRVPCTRDTFERLLTERGFLVGEVSGVVLVSGLTFREDFEMY